MVDNLCALSYLLVVLVYVIVLARALVIGIVVVLVTVIVLVLHLGFYEFTPFVNIIHEFHNPPPVIHLLNLGETRLGVLVLYVPAKFDLFVECILDRIEISNRFCGPQFTSPKSYTTLGETLSFLEYTIVIGYKIQFLGDLILELVSLRVEIFDIYLYIIYIYGIIRGRKGHVIVVGT